MAALLWINRVSGTGQTDARRDKGSRADMNRRRVQNHAVIVDHRQPVDVDIEAVVAAKIGLDIGQRVVGAQKLTQDGAALLRVLRGCLVICPTKLLGTSLRLRRGVFIPACIRRGTLHQVDWVHRILLCLIIIAGIRM